MRRSNIFLPLVVLSATLGQAYCQQGNKPNVFDKANNAANKVTNIITVFQPYLLKSRELFFDGKQLVNDVKNAAKRGSNSNSNYNNQYNNQYSSGSGSSSNSSGSYSSNGSGSNSSNGSGSSNNSGYSSSNQYSSDNQNSSSNQYSSNNSNQGNQNGSGSNGNSGYSSSGSGNTGYNNGDSNNSGYGNANYGQNYLQGQTLPINNPATINNDGTGNWGNQNNGLYGNCLDVMTGTVMGMGDAAQAPTSVDLMFFAPADGQNTYYIMTPGFARNNGTAGYMTEHVSEQVMQWTDVNESEVALTKLTIGQFNQIQTNGQIQSAVRNAQNYAGYYSSVGQKLDGQVLAVKMQMDNREVYALIAVIKQMGTSGSNGYLKIKIKSTGIDLNHDGQVDANAYQRQ